MYELSFFEKKNASNFISFLCWVLHTFKRHRDFIIATLDAKATRNIKSM